MLYKKPVYILEHLEPMLFQWCLIEYEHISKIVGKENLWFTNIKHEKDRKTLSKFGKVFRESVKNIKFENACVLDPEANKTLTPHDSKLFSCFIFGGILGDYPPKKRTKKELTRFVKNAVTRNIGKEQMSTDNAVYTVKQIIENRKKLSDLKFTDCASLKLNEFEYVDLPYRYNIVNNKLLMSKDIVKYLKQKKGF